MTTNSTTEYRVDEPEALDDIQRRIEKKKTALGRLKTLSDEVRELYADAAEMDAASRETVTQEIHEVQHDLVGSGTVDDLEAAKDRITEVIAAPYRQAVKRSRTTVCEIVEVDAEMDAETINELNEALQLHDPDDLREMAASFDRVRNQLTTLPGAAQTAVGHAITEDVHRFLNAPETRLEPLVETVVAQADALETVDETLAETPLGPEEPLAATTDYYGPGVDPVDADTVAQYITTIDDRLADTDGLALATVSQTHLKYGLPVEDPTQLVSLFETLSRHVTQCAGYEPTFVHADALVDAMDDPTTHEAAAVAGYVAEVDGFVESPHGAEPAKRLMTKLRSLKEAYEQWTKLYAKLLRRDAAAIDAVEQYLTELPTFSSMSEAIDLSEAEVAAEMVAERPIEAVVTHQAYEAWVKTLRGETSPDGAADIDHLLALVRGETVSAADVDPDAFETLGALLGDVLTLQLSTGTEEAS